MKQTFKTLLLTVSLFFLSALSAIGVQAQSNSHSWLEGTWVLDSIQVKETTPDGVRHKTVLQGDDNEFIIDWMWQITLDGQGTLSYKNEDSSNMSNVPYIMEDRNGDMATLIIINTTPYMVLQAQLLSENSMLMVHTYTITHGTHDQEISCRMYYSK